MKISRTKPIVVIGATGLLGRQIVKLLLLQGFTVVFQGRTEERVTAEVRALQSSILADAGKEKVRTAVALRTMKRLTTMVGLDPDVLAECELVITTVTEDMRVKVPILEELSKLVSPDCIIAENTSSLPLNALAAHVEHPERMAGFHYFNPADVQEAIEVGQIELKGLVPDERLETARHTQFRVLSCLLDFADSLNKTASLVAPTSGYVVNRLLFPPINDAYRMLGEELIRTVDRRANKVVPAERDEAKRRIDLLMRQGCGHPMGPFRLAGFVGLPVVVAILENLYAEFGYEFFKPVPELLAEFKAERKAA